MRKNDYINKRIAALVMSLTLVLLIIPTVTYAEGTESGTTENVTTTEEQKNEETEKTEEPKVPQIKVSKSGPGLKIKWNKIDGAKSYQVYRSYKKSSGYTLLKKGITGTSFKDKKVKSGKKAYYKVRAVKKNGKRTGWSKIKSGIIYRVYIETGHGRGDDGVWDPGCMWNGYQEAKLMVPICKSMAKYLKSKGVYVYTDAYNSNNLNLNVTLKRIKKYDVSVLVNVHCDYNKAPRGTMPLYRYADQRKLANCLNKGVHKYVNIKNRGLRKRTDLRTLNNTKGYCVACLFETGSIKNDNKLLRKKYDAYGKGLAKGVCDYLGVKW